MALVLAVTAALDAAAQGIKEQQLAPLPGGALPGTSRPDATPRHAASPETGTNGAKLAPLAREDEAAPRARSERLHVDAGVRGAYWRGTPFSLMAEALPRLSVRITSPAVRALTLEILTIPAEPLGGAPMAARLAALRAERLYAMGQLEAAAAAFQAAHLPKGDAARAPAEIETKLLLLGPSAACAAVAEHMAARSSAYLERASVACEAIAGAHGKAAQGLSALRERGMAVGDVFSGLVMAQQPDLARPLGMFGGADAWSVRLLAETQLPWPDDAIRLGAPALLRAVAASTNGPVAVRLGAAERAFLLGAIDRAALVTLYGTVRFRPEALGKAARSLAAHTPMQRALLFQAAAMASDRPARVEILANWWRAARAERAEVLTALITAPLLADVIPGAEWRENAVAISRVLFHAGDLERGLDWYAWLQGATIKDMEAYMRLGAIAQLADTGGGKAWTMADAEAWTVYQRGQASGERRIALWHALSEGLGTKNRDVSSKKARAAESLGASLDGTGRRFADWRNIQAAAAAGRQGEAILLMLTELGHDGVARAEPHALGAAVGVLAALGRGTEARRLAVEAALANGF